MVYFRVCDYIKYGWDVLLIDPDDGENIQRKLQATDSFNNSCDNSLIRSVPPAKDPQWTKALYKAPKVTFGTIFRFLVDRKVLLKKVVHIENVSEKRESCTIENIGKLNDINLSVASESVSYTRTLDKAYRFLFFFFFRMAMSKTLDCIQWQISSTIFVFGQMFCHP